MAMEPIELLCHGLLREYLARKGCVNTLATFDDEQPRNESSITNRKILANSLHIGKLVTKNKERGEVFSTFLEMIVDHLTSRHAAPAQPEPVREVIMKEQTPSSPIIKPRPHAIQTDSPLRHPSPSRVDSPTQRGTVRKPAPSNLRASFDLPLEDMSMGMSMNVSEMDVVHDPALDIGGSVKVPGSNLRQRPPSPMRAASPMRSRSESGLFSDTPPTSPKRVNFVLDSPKKQDQLRSSGGIPMGGSERGDDIVTKHARVYGNGATSNGAKAAVRLDLDPARPTTPPSSEPLDAVVSIADLEKLVFGVNMRGPKVFPEEWHQGFFFSDVPELKYGLTQISGGPCGVIAAVQTYILKELIFGPVYQKYGFNPPDAVRVTALVNAMSEILWQAGGWKSAKLVLNPLLPKRYKQYKVTDWTATSYNSLSDLQQAIRTNISAFTERAGSGILQFMYSAILTRGVAAIRSDMDVADTSLLAPHRYCSQELVNLLITGKATSNTFDGSINMEGTILRGIASKATVGFLTLMEKMGYCQVGNHLKSPTYPYDELGNQDEQYVITVDISSSSHTKVSEEDMVSPIDMCILTKWPTAICDWNGSEPLL